MIVTAALLGALFFAAAGYLGSLLGLVFAEHLPRLEGAPPQSRAPVSALIAGCAVIGAVVVTHAVSPGQVMEIAIICVALAAIWITDARRGLVPDVFTLGPLALILLVALWQHEWRLFVYALLPAAPFAVAAALSRGRGMGWGDVKLVALGGAVLGFEFSVAAFALACLAAVAVNYLRGQKRGAIAFAPYLATAIGVAIPIGMLR